MAGSSEIAGLCRVCESAGDGVFYGVYVCISCKDFFQSCEILSEFQPCKKYRQCTVVRDNRTDCSECRLKKCFNQLMRHPVHLETCPFMVNPDTKPAMVVISEIKIDQLLSSLRYAHQKSCHLTDPRFCPVDECSSDYQKNLSVSCWGLIKDNLLVPAFQGVVDFAKAIPCFQNLPPREQDHLLHEGAVGVLLLRLAITYDPKFDTLNFWNGQVIHRKDTNLPEGEEGFSWNLILDFAQKVHSLNLNDDEVNLFCLVLIINRYLVGQQNVLTLKTHIKLLDLLEDLAQSSKGQAITTGEFLVLIYQINYLKELHNNVRDR